MNPHVLDFFIRMMEEVMTGWVFENTETNGLVYRGPIENCWIERDKVHFQMTFLNTTDDQGRECESPVKHCYYYLEDILTVDRPQSWEFRFTHRVYGQFLVCPE
jgi:hypothetical protein